MPLGIIFLSHDIYSVHVLLYTSEMFRMWKVGPISLTRSIAFSTSGILGNMGKDGSVWLFVLYICEITLDRNDPLSM